MEDCEEREEVERDGGRGGGLKSVRSADLIACCTLTRELYLRELVNQGVGLVVFNVEV